MLMNRKMKRTRVLVTKLEEKDFGLVKSTTFLMIIENKAFVTVEMTAAAIWSPFSTYSFLKIS